MNTEYRVSTERQGASELGLEAQKSQSKTSPEQMDLCWLGIYAKDIIGGIIECSVSGLPADFGEPFGNSLESMIAHAMFAIPAIKGIEFGVGCGAAKMFGFY